VDGGEGRGCSLLSEMNVRDAVGEETEASKQRCRDDA
jgi:hypothetical protein